jgi:crotonobetainyl-CoA:carnitine CoA-transferase CaiB-like acyl-CoA transferase
VRNGRSAYFVQQNRGKQSLCLDFSKPESIARLRELAKKPDVVVENYGPGVMEKRGLDYASLSKLNPRVIMASISAFGRSGPLSHKVGYDFIAQAFSGLMHMTGDPKGRRCLSVWVSAIRQAVCTPSRPSASRSFIASAPAPGNTSTSRWSTASTTCTK